jgi:Gpi18-like mannosyltransferase
MWLMRVSSLAVREVPPNVVLALLACCAVAVARGLLPYAGPADGDFPLFLIPWMDQIRDQGLSSLAGGFSEYPPTYIYLLYLFSGLPTVEAVKLANVPFVALAAWGIGAIVKELTGEGRIAAAVVLIVPTLLLNAFAWGQADVIYTSFLIWCVYFAMKGRMGWASVMFGLALSFKLQAVFLAPMLLYLLLSGQLRIREAALAPITWLAMMLPAALAGRPWAEIFSVYFNQTTLMPELSMNAPNPWWFLHFFVDYQFGLAIGLAIGTGVAFLVVFQALRMERGPFTILLVATVCAALMPYVLPKMASRYFFVADLITLALVFARPQLWLAAVLVQIGSLLAYAGYFFAPWGTASLAFFPMTFGVIYVVTQMFRPAAELRPLAPAVAAAPSAKVSAKKRPPGCGSVTA